jgi:hypothetical protein
VDVEWLDTKNDKESVDRIVTYLPNLTKYSNKKDILKIYDEFFYQSDFILKKKGTILACTKNPEEIINAASKKKFKLDFHKVMWQGKESLNLIKFTK